MSKVTLQETIAPPFIEALNALLLIPFPARVSWKIGKIIRGIKKENDIYEQERLKALKKYAKLKKNGSIDFDDKKKAQFDTGKLEEFTRDLEELQKQEIDIGTVPLSLFGNIEIEPHVFAALMDKVITE